MSNCVGTQQLIFLHFLSFVSYVFVNMIADMQIIKKSYIRQFGQQNISRHQFGTKFDNLGLL